MILLPKFLDARAWNKLGGCEEEQSGYPGYRSIVWCWQLKTPFRQYANSACQNVNVAEQLQNPMIMKGFPVKKSSISDLRFFWPFWSHFPFWALQLSLFRACQELKCLHGLTSGLTGLMKWPLSQYNYWGQFWPSHCNVSDLHLFLPKQQCQLKRQLKDRSWLEWEWGPARMLVSKRLSGLFSKGTLL